jgi:uncharacterized membrane protein YcaP (DUF421 family)
MASHALPLLAVAGQTLGLYLFLVTAIRALGRRHIAQLTTVEFLAAALLGSSVETGLYAGQSSLAAGLVSAAVLLAADYALTRLCARRGLVHRLLVGRPIVLVRDGQVLRARLREASLTEDDLAQALRRRGYEDAADAALVVLEVDGSISVVPAEDDAQHAA